VEASAEPSEATVDPYLPGGAFTGLWRWSGFAPRSHEWPDDLGFRPGTSSVSLAATAGWFRPRSAGHPEERVVSFVDWRSGAYSSS
jgi:hypothetical protein